MAAISETLRQARLRSGVDLDKLAAKTKINPRYLEAIEMGDFDKLPGGIFARMFIKQYADALGLDGASFAEEYQRNSSFGNYSRTDLETTAGSRADFQPGVRGFFASGERARDERFTGMLSSLIWVVAAILVCAAAYYGLAHLPNRHSVVTVEAQPVRIPAKVAPQAPVPPDSAVSSPQEKVASPPTSQTPPPTSPIQLTLNATEPAWVTVIADGKTVVAEVLQPGSSKIIAAEKGARITLGNAGGVDIIFNGKKLEPFGPKGQVRTVDFTSWGAQVVSRTPPNPDPLR